MNPTPDAVITTRSKGRSFAVCYQSIGSRLAHRLLTSMPTSQTSDSASICSSLTDSTRSSSAESIAFIKRATQRRLASMSSAGVPTASKLTTRSGARSRWFAPIQTERPIKDTANARRKQIAVQCWVQQQQALKPDLSTVFEQFAQSITASTGLQ